MYQNTVPEEDDDAPVNAIPLGFPGMGPNYQSSSGTSGSDVGDIVGSDGHVEQLPPYTRYADNTLAKGNMEPIDGPIIVESHSPDSQELQVMTSSGSSQQPHLEMGRELSEEEARKEGWKAKAQRRVCGGIPLWVLIILLTVTILAAALGGVIGGVIGNRKGTDRAIAQGA